ncbi:MAG TPA: TolC family protein [Vicinamibacterales bacterium]|nr:TolC family protein [Vicinamibacterales bacterium]
MRLKQQISTRPAVGAAAALAVCLFATGRQVSASEQQGTQQPPAVVAPAPAPQSTGPELRISADDAVRMALENNLGVQSARLGPQIGTYGVAQARGAFIPTLFSSTQTRSATSPPDFFASGGSGDVTTRESLQTNFGVNQSLPWGGGRYSLALDASRQTVNFISSFNPQLGSNLSAQVTQPLLRNFLIDGNRQQLMIARKNEEIADIQLRQQLTSTERSVRSAYYDLIGALGQLDVTRQSLELSQRSLKDNERRVEVGTMAQIDILEAQAEVARNEEAVIIAEASIRSFEDNLRTLILNPKQADFWTARIIPTERPTLTPQPVDVEAAVQAALANRTDIAQARKRLESTQIGLDFARNQKLPDVNLIASYNTVGVAGTVFEFDPQGGFPPTVLNQTQRSFADALRDVFGNDFKTWSVQLQINYPIGTSQADAGLAAARLEREQEVNGIRDLEVQVTADVRNAGRQVSTSQQRVEATRKAREFAERRLEAENKRVTVGLSTTFQLFQAQRDLDSAKQGELRALIDYNRALVNFQAVQQAPLTGR